MLRCPFCQNTAKPLTTIRSRDIGLCSECELQFVVAQPTDPELAALYKNLYHQANAEIAFTTADYYRQLLDLNILKYFSLRPNVTILDYGCGDGGLVEMLRARGFNAYGVDQFIPEDRSARHMFRSFEELERHVPEVRQFDLIVSNQVIEHLRKPWIDLEVLWGKLRPDGVLFITTPNFSGLRARLLGERYEQYINPTHLFFLTPTSLRKMMERVCGCSPQRIPSRINFRRESSIHNFSDRVLQVLGMDGSFALAVRKS